MAVSSATLKSYLDQWDEYFEARNDSEEDLLSRLKKFAFDGHLRSCKFRSICWRVFLNCLPNDTSKWKDAIRESRQHYIEVKNKHMTNPNAEKDLTSDLNVENPLSQNDKSAWKSFFENIELQKSIERDVTRTFPEMEYFHDKKVHKLLVNILFCYAREHSELSYRQGMHELLAPLVFIIHCDLQAACHGREIGALKDLIDIILDEAYIEHDAYHMFCHLMESTNPWYSVTETRKQQPTIDEEAQDDCAEKPDTRTPIQTLPFQPQEMATNGGTTLVITNKLNHIHNTLLVQHDIQLHTHLNRLEIIPQVFGLRWIRLLFGREFSLQDLLVLWDAMFADSSTLDLVDYLFVAMLIHIRNYLLNADYSTCMQILMKYPPVDDINDIVIAAMNIRQLKGRSFADSLKENVPTNISDSKMPRAERNAKATSAPNMNSTKQSTLTRMLKDFTRKVIPENRAVPPRSSHLNDPTGHVRSPGQIKTSNSARWSNGTPPFFKQSRSMNDTPRVAEMYNRNPSQLENEVLVLRQELERISQMCMYCSDKIDACVTVLQSNVSSVTSDGIALDSQHDDENPTSGNEVDAVTSEQKKFEQEQILVTVASLKQTRDLLKGTLSFNPNLREYRTKRARQRGSGTDEDSAPKSVSNPTAESGDTKPRSVTS